MLIELINLIPEPLAEIVNWPTDIWSKQACFESGRRYLLYAPSGNGKTSLINTLCGLRNNYQGDFYIDNNSGRSLKLDYWCELRRSRLSIMFQDLRLFPELTVEENLHLKILLSDSVLEPDPWNMLDRLGMSSTLQQKINTLSWGERQRVALIRSLSQPFEILLLDEPFSHLDEENIKTACKLIEEACAIRDAGLILTSLGGQNQYPLRIDEQLKI